MHPRPTAFSALAALLTLAASAAFAADPGFTVTAPGAASADGLPRELRAAPLCSERPAYPLQAYRKKAEGLTVVRATVGVDGRIRLLTLYHSSGGTTNHRDLDDAVASVLAGCHWEVVSPASYKEAVEVDLSYRWRMAEHEDDH
jgi:outer membrane biosynthesis protein TonB